MLCIPVWNAASVTLRLSSDHNAEPAARRLSTVRWRALHRMHHICAYSMNKFDSVDCCNPVTQSHCLPTRGGDA